MKKLLTLSFAAILALSCFAQKYDLPRKNEGLKGSVSSVEIKRYLAGSTEVNKVTTMLFDANGNKVSTVETGKGSVSTTTYMRDEQGRPTQITEVVTTDGKKTTHLVTTYTYESKDSWEVMQLDKLTNAVVFTEQTRAPGYGLTQYRKVISPLGEITNHHVGFDAKGNNLFDKIFDETDVWQRAVQIEYNANNQLAKRTYSAIKTAKKIEVFTYTVSDANGNWTKRDISEKDKVVATEEQNTSYR